MTGASDQVAVGRRVLIVSADMGGGHDATGRALAERVRQLWPGSRVSWVDTLDVMGPGVGRLFRRTYVTNVERTPWLYEFFWSSLWRHRWFAKAFKAFTGRWAGRRLAPVVEGFDPDLILSTYPLGSAGLAWLREHRGIGVPVGAWVSDFAPSPFWVYQQLDLTLVTHPSALPLAAVAAPGAPLGVCAPPVPSPFHPGDRVTAAEQCGVDPSRQLVVVSCGAYGFGAVEEAIRALAGVGDALQVIAVCGRNEPLAARLASLGVPAGRLLVRGWVDDMPTLLRAADLLVTNAGGVTALEAWATGTAVVMYRPIAAHGVANAALMTASGLAETAHTPDALVACVRTRLGAAVPRIPAGSGRETCLPMLGLPALASTPPPAVRRPGRAPSPSWPVRARDAFHLPAGSVTQQIGAVLDLGPRGDGRALDHDALVDLLDRRLPAITMLRRRPVTRGPWRRPGWVVDRYVDPAEHLDEIELRPAEGEGTAALGRFWSQRLPAGRPLWRMLLVSGLPDGRTRVAVKLHPALGDSRSAIDVLERLLDPPDGRPFEDRSAGQVGPARAGRSPVARIRDGLRHIALTARGLFRLAPPGPAPLRTPNHPPVTSCRRLITTDLPTTQVLDAARSCGVEVSELMCALTAEAVRRSYPGRPVPQRLRMMFTGSDLRRVPVSSPGNRVEAVILDLPAEHTPLRARVATIRNRLRASLVGGEPAAARLVTRTVGALPTPLCAAVARRIHARRHVDVAVAYVSGRHRCQLLAGAPVRAVAPVVGVADGVPIGVGIRCSEETTDVGVLVDEQLVASGEAVTAALRAGLEELAGERPHAGTGD